MGASDFRSLMPSPSLFRLVGGCAFLCAKYRISMVTACSSSSSMRLLIPGVATQSCRFVCAAVACQRLETIGLPQCGHFGTFHLHGRLHPVPLRLACFRAYASSPPLPANLQGSIPDPWLAVIWAGLSPAGTRDIAMPQQRPDTISAFHETSAASNSRATSNIHPPAFAGGCNGMP